MSDPTRSAPPGISRDGASVPGPGAEAQLVARLKRREAQAFEELVREHGPKMLGLARRLVRDDELARDVVQEGFASAFRAIDGFAGDARLSTWLYRIVVNNALMKLRGRRRRPEEPIEPLLPTFKDDGHHAVQFRAWADPEQALARRETREAVRRAVDRLPESYRAVLVLRDLQEMSTAEAARALGVTENAVKIRLHRARQALRTLLDDRFRRGDG
jgi:RNA polymerase sigma-70 factor (ECF subfamily)